MKKFASIIFVFVYVFIMITPAAAAEIEKFQDVPDDAWYAEAVYKLVESGVINGFEDNTFRANNTLTVDQLIKMVVISIGKQLQPGTRYWAQPYIDYAISTGLVQQGEFNNYKRPITRGEIARILVRAMKDEVYPENYVMYQSMIKDFENASDTDREYILKAFVSGIMEGYPDKTFGANKNLTRAEAATVVLRLTDKSLRKIPVLPTQTGNEGFIVPDLRIVYHYDLGDSYYYTINLANIDMYIGKGYKVNVECINYPELNKREMNWGKDWQTAISGYIQVDTFSHPSFDGKIYYQYYQWYLDRNYTKFTYKVGMKIDFKVSFDNGKEIKSYYISGVIQDRKFLY
jgi:hypothetical protein